MGSLRNPFVCAAAGWLVAATAGQAAERPNVVIIYADDLGYGDLGCYGAARIKTPNLDRLAAEGTRFTSFYSCANVCTPSRAGLLTGRYPIRSGLTRVLFPQSKDGIDAGETTLAEMLRAAGYATGCVGKWHLGHLPAYLPTRHGFDRYFGIPYSNDMKPTPLLRGETTLEEPAHQPTLTQRYTAEAVQFLTDHKDRPFFLYLAHTMPHVPLAVSERFKGKSAAGFYGDVIEELDWSVGELLIALDKLKLAERTLIIFSSDNGPWLAKKDHGGSAGMLRLGKGTCFEGGIRVPCLARWPGQIKAGRVESRPAIMLDWLPTLAQLTDAKLPADRVIDGKDISGLLRGDGRRADEEFFFYSVEALQAHRSGPWKLKIPFKGKVYGEAWEHPLLLFNLDDDPGEMTNVAEKQPEIVARLQKQMKEFQAKLGPVPTTKK